MIISEAGIMARGFPLVYSQNHKVGIKGTDFILKTAYMTAILNLSDFSFQNSIEYLETNNYVVAFHIDQLSGSNSSKPETIIAYVIFSRKNKHRLDKFISKKIKPCLFKILNEFKKDYVGSGVSAIYVFAPFKEKVDKVFEIGSKNIENKFKELLSR